MSLKSVTNIFEETQASSVASVDTAAATALKMDSIEESAYLTPSPLIGLMQLQSNIETLSGLQKKLQFLRGEIQEIILNNQKD